VKVLLDADIYDAVCLAYRLAGLAHWKPASTGPREIALKVDAARFLAHYFK
jgi:hypothetical protein